MANWGNVYYIHCSDSLKIQTAIEKIFSTEKRIKINRPAERTIGRSDHDEPMQYGNAAQCPIWGMALLAGNHNWTAIQTAPFELLCERNEANNRYRLAELAWELKTTCIYFGLYDGVSSILAEALPNGEYTVSGSNNNDKNDITNFHGFPIGVHNSIARFQLCKPGKFPAQTEENTAFYAAFKSLFTRFYTGEESDSFDDMISDEDIAEAIGKVLCGNNFAHWHNSLNIEHLISHKKITNTDCVEMYFKKIHLFST